MRSKLFWYLIWFLVFTELFGTGGLLTVYLRYPLIGVCALGSILVSLVIHEFAHAWAADRLGDPNPRLAGRLSLNPLRHLDPTGTLFIVLTGFGWGKPVQFDPYNLADPVKDGALIAAAGPVSNLLLAVGCALVLRLGFLPQVGQFFLEYLFATNVQLAVFNLLPVYPLDGHHLLRAFLPPTTRTAYDFFNARFGLLVAFILILPIFGHQSIANHLITPAINLTTHLLLGSG